MKLVILWITVCCGISGWRLQNCSKNVNRPRTDEESLLDKLLDGYTTAARPVFNSSKTVDVKMMFSLYYIKELNLKDQVLTTTGSCVFEWYDERLRWDDRNIPIKRIAIEASHLWTPEIISINGAENLYFDFEQMLQVRATINPEGFVIWKPSGVFKTVCEIDITYYHFDEQICSLEFGAIAYHATMMNLTLLSRHIDLDAYSSNAEWVIMNTSADWSQFYYFSRPDERYPSIGFMVHLKRRYIFYIMNIILPSAMTSVLLVSIFFCPQEEKVAIGIMVLLSFELHLLNIAENIPKSSKTLPILGIYLTCTMAITTLSLLLTIFVLNLHRITDRPIPRWLNRLVLGFLAKLMCKTLSKKSLRSTDRQQDDVQLENEVLFLENNVAVKNHDKNQDISRKWKQIAEVLDRLFFWIIISTFIMTLCLLCI